MMKNKNLYYTAERNVQIVIALLKAHGIKRVIASPGTTNMTFVGSIQNDPWFEIWSSVDERSAAYMACGMAEETGEPVVLSCTGATASRNYMPGLTEAYYRKLPVLAITSHRGTHAIGHLLDQQIDRRVIPNDVAVESVTIPMVRVDSDAHYCMIEANKAILALKLNGGGPVHINLFTEYDQDFSIKELPIVRVIHRYTYFDKLPSLPENAKIGIFIGSHRRFTSLEIEAIERFCGCYNAVVFCDHTSGYYGNFAIFSHLLNMQLRYGASIFNLDLLIHLGEVSGTAHMGGREVWRVNEDGALRDPFDALKKVFMMPESVFFNYYTQGIDPIAFKTSFWESCRREQEYAEKAVKELPFSNGWLAKITLPRLPNNAELHMGIFNSLRTWSCFEWPVGIAGSCNVGGFGIDGSISTLVGASLNNPKKIYFGVLGDLAFFYDMNALGNRHIGKNLRILLVNNGRGMEFRLSSHPCQQVFGEDADSFMAAAGHFGNQSQSLVRGYVEALGFEYLSARSKEEYLEHIEHFVSPELFERPIVMEIFVDKQDEDRALELIQNALVDVKQGIKKIIRDVVGMDFYRSVKKYLEI